MKKYLILIFTLLVITFPLKAQAQKKQNTYYFNQQDVEVINPDSAYYSRVIQEPDSGSTFFNLIEFYKGRILKSRGKVIVFYPNLIYQETLIRYFPNERKASISNYRNGILIGSEYLYYENGLIKEERLYLENKEKTYNPKRIIYKTISYSNPQGKSLLDKDGTGSFNLEHGNGNREKGTYLNGFKVGTWESYNKKDNESYIDDYEEGVYKSGKTIKADGEIVNYQELEKLPEFKGGISAFGKFLVNNLKYPPNSRDSKIQGKVFIKFNVNANGLLSDFEIIDGVNNELNQEALRVIKLLPSWTPALKRGIPQSTSYTVPISFQLSQ